MSVMSSERDRKSRINSHASAEFSKQLLMTFSLKLEDVVEAVDPNLHSDYYELSLHLQRLSGSSGKLIF